MKKIFLFILIVGFFTLVGCEKETKKDINPIQCLETQTLVEGICVTNETPPLCADGMEYKDGVCELIEVICIAPEEKVDNECMIVTCAEYFDRVDGVCVQTSCAEGFELLNGVCAEEQAHPLELAIEQTKQLDNYEMTIIITNGDIIETMLIRIDGTIAYMKYLDEEHFYEKTDDVCFEYYYGSDIFVKEVIDCIETDVTPNFLHALDFEWFNTSESPYTINESFESIMNSVIDGVMDFEIITDDGYIEEIHYSLNNSALIIDVQMTILNIGGVDIKIPLVQE